MIYNDLSEHRKDNVYPSKVQLYKKMTMNLLRFFIIKNFKKLYY